MFSLRIDTSHFCNYVFATWYHYILTYVVVYQYITNDVYYYFYNNKGRKLYCLKNRILGGPHQKITEAIECNEIDHFL